MLGNTDDRVTAGKLITRTIEYLELPPQTGFRSVLSNLLTGRFSYSDSQTEAISDNEAEVIMMASTQRAAAIPKIEHCIG